VVSSLTFWRTRPALQLKRDQQAPLAVVASRATVLWDPMQTIIAATSNNHQIESYFFPSAKANARRLEETIGKAIGLSLFTVLVGGDNLSLSLFAAFDQSLFHSFSDESVEPEVWTNQHLLMGIRLGKLPLKQLHYAHAHLRREWFGQSWSRLGTTVAIGWPCRCLRLLGWLDQAGAFIAG